MPENGDDNSLFENFSFEDNLIIEGAEIETDNATSEQTQEEKQKPSGEIKDEAATDTSNETIELNFDDPSVSDENSDDSITSSDTDDSASSSSPLSLVTEALSAEGFFELEDGELDDIEDPAEFLRTKLNKVIEDKAKSNLSPKKLEALEAFEKGVPIQDYVNSNAAETQYANITDDQIQSNEQWQSELVTRSLKARGFSDEEIQDEIATYKEVGSDKLIQKAIASKNHLIQVEQQRRELMVKEAEAKQQADAEAREQSLSTLKEKVNAQTHFIEGLELTDKTKEDLYKIMTTPVAEDKHGNPVNAVGVAREKDPERFNMLMTYYYNLGLFNENPDLSKLQKVAETKTAKGLNTLFKEGTDFLKSGSSKNAKPKSDNDFGLEFI